MTKDEVVIGAVYVVKVSGRLAHVQVMETCLRGGWMGRNIATGREIRIKTAAKLRRAVRQAVEP